MDDCKLRSFITNDGVTLKYYDTDAANSDRPIMILLHGFTGSAKVWQHNVPAFRGEFRVIALDLRGHGDSDKPDDGFHVSRLAMDFRELAVELARLRNMSIDQFTCFAIGASLGCSILWSYAELFTPGIFTQLVFVDQAPLQNKAQDGWDERFCNRSMNNVDALQGLQATLASDPKSAHQGTIDACLGYRQKGAHNGTPSQKVKDDDDAFFLAEALKCKGEWLGKLMADHTALDWRPTITAKFGHASGFHIPVLVVASSISGCFPSKGPLEVSRLINEQRNQVTSGIAQGYEAEWGGHWCYWEDPKRFNLLIDNWLRKKDLNFEMNLNDVHLGQPLEL